VGAARARPRPLVVSPGRCPLSSLLLALWVFWQSRIFAIFSRIFPESQISAQKRDTKAILLKIALVRVSCIQNTQIRGETIAKVFGKVYTFWTYQLLKDGPSIAWEEIVSLFYSKFYPPSEIDKDRNRIYNFWPYDGESIAQAWGRLKLLILKCPIHELPSNIVIDIFMRGLLFMKRNFWMLPVLDHLPI
jgi:hypothetical protein